MFAVVRTGGKQYRVAPGAIFTVEKLEAAAGDKINLEEVLFLNDGKKVQLGAPHVIGASVEVSVVEQKRADKIIVFKKKRRQNYRRKMGHRQHQTVLKVEAIHSK
jgi:large subunit ribosomal protein L21